MNDDTEYTPAEICEIFGIAKSTLLRWEREGKIPAPDRDLQGRRRYTQKHRAKIAMLLMQRDYQRLVNTENEPGAAERAAALQEQISLQKLTDLQDESGLYELAESKHLQPNTIYRLLEEAQRHSLSDPIFSRIVQVIYKQTSKTGNE